MKSHKNADSIQSKISRKLHGCILPKLCNYRFFCYLYPSYRHYILRKENKAPCEDISDLYFTQRPNYGAGIGHQMANWNAGYWFAKQFGLKYAYSHFSLQEWDDFLGFKENIITVEELKKKKYKPVLLPPFSENVSQSLDLMKKIITSYMGTKTIFFAELDTGYKAQIGVMEDIKRKFNEASVRKKDTLIYKENEYNIAVHIRRGDISKKNKNENLTMRWLENDYYVNILRTIIGKIECTRPKHIYIFSQGKKEDFNDFSVFENLTLCLDMPAIDTFLHMVRADMLVTSRSSFSYKPAMLSDGIRICPGSFWHDYPQRDEWILVDDDGVMKQSDINMINKLLNY